MHGLWSVTRRAIASVLHLRQRNGPLGDTPSLVGQFLGDFIMRKITLSKRLTYKYSSAYADLDRHIEDMGTARALGEKTIKRDAESRTTLGLFLVSSKFRPSNVKRAFYDTLRYSCRCEHDCCGCLQTSVSKVRHLGKGLYAVKLSSYVNC